MSTRYVWDKYNIKAGGMYTWKQYKAKSYRSTWEILVGTGLVDYRINTDEDLNFMGNGAYSGINGESISVGPDTYNDLVGRVIGFYVSGIDYLFRVYVVDSVKSVDLSENGQHQFIYNVKVYEEYLRFDRQTQEFECEVFDNCTGQYLGDVTSEDGEKYPNNGFCGSVKGFLSVYKDMTYTRTYTKGTTKIDRVCSTSKSTYTADGAYNGYWYIYMGEDSIDPVAVRYSVSEPRGGDTVIAAITPAGSNNKYGGTISYQWQYTTDGNTWINSGSKTTATQKSFTIPKGVDLFRVRVLASDGYGFTSQTYVYGETLKVMNIRAYIGVDGKARKIKKIYIGVDGVAREVKAGYIGVDGKARSWF